MNEGTKLRLEEELKKMINQAEQKNTEQEQRIIKTGTGNVIRRRAGEKDKRFSV